MASRIETSAPPNRTVDVIVNSVSGIGAPDQTNRLQELFEETGLDARIALSSTGSDVERLARLAAQSDSPIVVAAGGDGTIRGVASALVGTEKLLGILPLGTFNHLAKDLGLPLDLDGAVRVIADGNAARIDVGEVNGRIFLNNSSLGLYPSIVHAREQRQRLGQQKWPALVRASLEVLHRYPFLDVRFRIDGEEYTSRTPFLFIGNNEYETESARIGGRARLDGGQLSLYFSNRTGRIGLLRLALRALLKQLPRDDQFVAMQTTELVIETRRRKVTVATDGEVVRMKPPLRYRIRPKALRVIVSGVREEGFGGRRTGS